eukprot:1077244-Prorocentrum_minimum.AAC.1
MKNSILPPTSRGRCGKSCGPPRARPPPSPRGRGRSWRCATSSPTRTAPRTAQPPSCRRSPPTRYCTATVPELYCTVTEFNKAQLRTWTKAERRERAEAQHRAYVR